MKVLVAGATGYLGRFIVYSLYQKGYYIRILARKKSVNKLKYQGKFLEPPIYDIVDDIFVGEATKPESIKNICNDMDIVISTLGITRQRDGVSFWDVDYQANKNLLEEAVNSNVKKFVFVSAYKANKFTHLNMVNARETFVKELKQKLPYIIVRPTGFFSDLTEIFTMATKGKVWLIGNGNNKTNPIYGEDLANFIVENLNKVNVELNIGGPQILTHNEIAIIAFKVLNKKPNISYLSPRVLKYFSYLVKPFSRHYYDLIQFFITLFSEEDFVAPQYGKMTLSEYYSILNKNGNTPPIKLNNNKIAKNR